MFPLTSLLPLMPLSSAAAGASIAAGIFVVPNCVYAGLSERATTLAYPLTLRAAASDGLWEKTWLDKSTKWWMDGYRGGQPEIALIGEALRDAFDATKIWPERQQGIRTNFSINIRRNLGAEIHNLLKAYSLDAEILQGIEKSPMWQDFRSRPDGKFRNAHKLNHDLISNRLLERVEHMINLFDVADMNLTQDVMGALDNAVFDSVTSLKRRSYYKTNNKYKETMKDPDGLEEESLALVRRMTEQEKIEFLIENESYFSGIFNVPEALKHLLPQRVGITIRQSMYSDSKFMEQSPQSYAAMENRMISLRQKLDQFFLNRHAMQNISSPATNTARFVAGATRTAIVGSWSKAASWVRGSLVKVVTEPPSPAAEIPLLTNQPPEDFLNETIIEPVKVPVPRETPPAPPSI